MTCILSTLIAAVLGVATAHAQLTGTIVFNGGNSSGILAINLSDGSVNQLTPAGEAVSNPKISPDGCRVVFMVSLSGKTGGTALDIMNLDPKNPHRRRLISSGGGVPSWSPDNKTIAFGNDSIWLLDTTETTPLPRPQLLIDHGAWPVFSAEGNRVVFSSQKLNRRDWDLWIMNADGSNAHLLLGFSGADIDVGGWSSNGVVFAHTGYDIYTYNPATLDLKRLTTAREDDYEPGWSPDGTRIVFASFRTPGGLYTMNADGTNQTWLHSGRQPSWGPLCASPVSAS
jgi:TolB protein